MLSSMVRRDRRFSRHLLLTSKGSALAGPFFFVTRSTASRTRNTARTRSECQVFEVQAYQPVDLRLSFLRRAAQSTPGGFWAFNFGMPLSFPQERSWPICRPSAENRHAGAVLSDLVGDVGLAPRWSHHPISRTSPAKRLTGPLDCRRTLHTPTRSPANPLVYIEGP
jgi:hypothetical protein